MSHVRISACVSLAAVLFSRRSGGRRAAASLAAASPSTAPLQGGVNGNRGRKLLALAQPIQQDKTTSSTTKKKLREKKEREKSYFYAPAQRPGEFIISFSGHGVSSKRRQVHENINPAVDSRATRVRRWCW